MFIGSFSCWIQNGTVELPDMFAADTVSFSCSFGTYNENKRFILFLSKANQTSFNPWFVRQMGRFGGKAVMRGGKLKLPRKAAGYFVDGGRLELIGMGASFVLREPNGKIFWNTLPDGKITLISVGKTACELAFGFSELNIPLDRSSFHYGNMPALFRHLLCGFDTDITSLESSPNIPRLSLGEAPTPNLSKEIEENLWVALRHTGLSLVFTDLTDAENCTAAIGILKLAKEWEKPTIFIAAVPTGADDEVGYQNVMETLSKIHEISFRGSTIILWKQNLDDQSLLTDLTYSLSGILLPFTQFRRADSRLLSARDVLFSGACMELSVHTFERIDGLSKLKDELQNATKYFGDAYIAAFGGYHLSHNELLSILPDSKKILPFSFCYGNSPQFKDELVLISFTPFLI